MFPLSVSRDNLKEAIEMTVQKIFFPLFSWFSLPASSQGHGMGGSDRLVLGGEEGGASQCVRAAPDKAENGLPNAA